MPIDHGTYETAIEFNLDPITCALNGGEDYELLFTIKPADYEKVKNHPDIHIVKEGISLQSDPSIPSIK